MAQLHPFICIEGVDGVGKSTVAKRLADRLDGTYYKTPPAPYDVVRAVIDSTARPMARFYFYASAVAFAAQEIAELRKAAPVVCDRYIYSTLAYHLIMDPHLRYGVTDFDLELPDHSFLLIASEVERRSRLESRDGGQRLHDFLLEANSDFLNRVQRKFLELGLDVVDTTGVAPDAVVEIIMAALRREGAYQKKELTA